MTLPSDFILRTRELLGNNLALLEAALQTEVPVSIRLNTTKADNALEYEKVSWCETGYYLPERAPFTFDPLFHAGGYYVQEASSMFLEQAVGQHIQGAVKCLDLCAAPGGKSTHLANILPEGSLLVSNEIIRNRSHILMENMTKWGKPDTIVANANPADFGQLTHFFDVMVADVPCSGEGMFRKDPNSMNEWSVTNVTLCAARQRKILQDAWNTLKPGGILVYSTCTYNTEENEDNIHYIAETLGATPLDVPVPDGWGITGALKYDFPVYRFFPHKTKGEGFFLAVLRKNETDSIPLKYKSAKEKKKKNSLPPAEVRQWLAEPDRFIVEMADTMIRAIPCHYREEYSFLSSRIHLVSAGICLGEVKGKDIVPSQSLAMSLALNKKSFYIQELTWEEAIKYLKKETFPIPANTPKSHILLTYKSLPLGFAKHLGNRINNLYPQEWKIRTTYLPADKPTVI